MKGVIPYWTILRMKWEAVGGGHWSVALSNDRRPMNPCHKWTNKQSHSFKYYTIHNYHRRNLIPIKSQQSFKTETTILLFWFLFMRREISLNARLNTDKLNWHRRWENNLGFGAAMLKEKGLFFFFLFFFPAARLLTVSPVEQGWAGPGKGILRLSHL